MIKPICVDLAYPSLDKVVQSKSQAMLISPAYSGLYSELSAVLQYVYHHLNFEVYNKETADVLMGISLCEMRHFEILGQTLLKLGVDPIFTVYPPIPSTFYSTCKIDYSKTPQKMLLDDIAGELKAIALYNKIMENLTDEAVSAIIARIILDEELHVKVLKAEIEKYGNKAKN